VIIDLGPAEGSVDKKIEFLGVRPVKMERKAIIVSISFRKEMAQLKHNQTEALK